jgi:hypothetical protein
MVLGVGSSLCLACSRFAASTWPSAANVSTWIASRHGVSEMEACVWKYPIERAFASSSGFRKISLPSPSRSTLSQSNAYISA